MAGAPQNAVRYGQRRERSLKLGAALQDARFERLRSHRRTDRRIRQSRNTCRTVVIVFLYLAGQYWDPEFSPNTTEILRWQWNKLCVKRSVFGPDVSHLRSLRVVIVPVDVLRPRNISVGIPAD